MKSLRLKLPLDHLSKSSYIVYTILKSTAILLPQFPKFQDYRYAPPCLSKRPIFCPMEKALNHVFLRFRNSLLPLSKETKF